MLKSKYLLLLVFIWHATKGIAQHQISKYEIRWAFAHPFAAYKVKRLLPKAQQVYKTVIKEKVLDGLESGGTSDAFRHSFTMAFLAQKIKVKKLCKLGKAHEKGNKYFFYKNRNEIDERADSLACEMDLRNNELGFKIGSSNKKLPIGGLKNEIIHQIKSGNAWILRKNDQNQYVFCNNEPILIENYKNYWFVPKCLIRSNE